MTLLESLDLACGQRRVQGEAVPLSAEGLRSLSADLRELLVDAFNTVRVDAPSLPPRLKAVVGKFSSTVL